MPEQIPIVENEIKKETGEVKAEDEVSAAPAQKLVTEMGTYVTQSALSSSRPSKKDEDRSERAQSHSRCDWSVLKKVLAANDNHLLLSLRPPLRGFLMDGDFYVAASLATTLTKVALRYVAIVQDKKKQNVSGCHGNTSSSSSNITNLTKARSSTVLRGRGHAHHGHRAAPGQVVAAQEAHHGRRRGPHLAVPQGAVGVLAAHERHLQQGVPQVPVAHAGCQAGGGEAVAEGKGRWVNTQYFTAVSSTFWENPGY